MRNTSKIKEEAKKIAKLSTLLEECKSDNVDDYLAIINDLQNRLNTLKDKLNKLKFFDVSLTRMLNNTIELTDRAFEKSNINSMLEKIGKIEYKTDREYTEISSEILKVLDDISEDAEVKEYFNTCTDTSKENIKSGVTRLFDMLNDARCSDDLQKNKEFENIMKAYGVAVKILKNSEIKPIEKVLRLTMIADSSKFCSSAWKETLLKVLTSLKEYMDSEIKTDINTDDALAKSIVEIFACARIKVAEDIANGIIEQENVPEEYRPHWVDICVNTLNNEYNFNLPDIQVKDIYISLADKLKIQYLFLRELEEYPVDDVVFDKACEIFYDEISMNLATKNDKNLSKMRKNINVNGNLLAQVVDWARKYINKNNLNEEEPDVVEFIYKYIMNANNSDKIKYTAITEIMKYYGFIDEREITTEMWYKDPNISVTRINRALEDIKTEEDKKEFLDKLLYIRDNTDEIYFRFTSDNFYIRKYLSKEKTKELIKASVERDGVTFLMQECKKGNEDNIKTLIELGEDVKAENKMGSHALLYAVKYTQNSNIIKMLVKEGANVNKGNKNGITPLMVAMLTKKNDVVVKTLIDLGADVNKAENDGYTTLMMAVLNFADIKIIKMLLEAGANVDKKCETEGITALDIAQAMKNKEVEELLNDYKIRQSNIKLNNVLDTKEKTLDRENI